MATVKEDLPHVLRTAHERRISGQWLATLSRIDQINSTIRLLQLSITPNQPPLRHLPGQYIDLTIPNINVVGGFTITSPPQTALSFLHPTKSNTPNSPTHGLTKPYIELAIQRSDNNPPATYLWRPSNTILGTEVTFKVGGEFAFPPLTLNKQECEDLQRVVFIAGGVGVNPIMSMLSAMDVVGPGKIGGMAKDVRVLYTFRRGVDEQGKKGKVLFEERIEVLARKWEGKEGTKVRVELFDTGSSEAEEVGDGCVKRRKGRIKKEDLIEALGSVDGRRKTVVYVCGVPGMTDEFVDFLRSQQGMEEKRVLCEKWW